MIHRTKVCALYLLSMCIILVGCTKEATQEPITLTVNYPSERLFYQKYGRDFEQKYPNITIKVIDPNLIENSENINVDIIFIDQLKVYKQMIEKGKLLNLDPLIQNSKYPLSEITPIALQSLRSDLNGGIYGLSPTFISHALFYNKDLFIEYGVPFPTNQMTWSEVLDLAERFPTNNASGERVYGFKSDYYMNIAFSMILRMGQTEGLTFINPTTLKMNLSSAEWREIFNKVVESFRKDVIYDQEESETGEIAPSPILTNTAAMEIQSYSMAYNFDSYSEFIGGNPINWDMVTVPVPTRNKNQSDYYEIHEIYSISNSTPYKEEAWKFIDFVTNNDQNMGAKHEKQLLSGLPVKTDLIKPVGNHDVSPLFLLDPAPYSNDPYDAVNYEILNAFKEVGQKAVEDTIQNALSIDEAIQQIEIEGQRAVDEGKMRLELDRNQ